MGKRSRQPRTAAEPKPTGRAGRRAELKRRADEASRVAEAKLKDRPKAPWDPFPLMELAIFFGLILLVVGALVGDNLGNGLMAAGLVLACIGGLDTILREHFNGFRPHSGMLAGIAALLALIVSTSVLTIGIAPRAAIAIGVFALLFPVLRRDYIRRADGRGVL